MQPYFEHPAEEALERFLLNQSREPELEIVESHILACATCVERLENLELEIATTKAALEQLEQRDRAKQFKVSRRGWSSWFTFPVFAGAGAMAVAALALIVSIPAQVDLSAQRGNETRIVPEWRPLNVHLNATNLPDGKVAVQLVNAQGKEVWKGVTAVSHEQAEVRLPRMMKNGDYFLRVYEPSNQVAEGELLSEFPFEVK